MSRTPRSEKIYQALFKAGSDFDPTKIPESLEPLYISSLSTATGISPNNISMELNRMYSDNRVMRVRGRPVIYFAKENVERLIKKPLPSSEFASLEEFLVFLGVKASPNPSFGFPEIDAAADSEFDSLIGSSKSLRTDIEQAKAAILYPPHGLHTLITGPTGVGKSHFAGAMFDYAKKSGRLSESAPLITFNCADYAENPQLLMSQLFGYSKGAFTGAVTSNPGLVEMADKGILFLDEIHRLHPEGQEKLFLLMDKGIFSRLGETTKTRHAEVLLVCATTESPESTMLGTFLRRIPVYIKLPSLSERSILERLQLVFFFFWGQAEKLKEKIIVDRQIISTFVHYDCPGNIGQLASDIRLTCANAYYKSLLLHRDYLEIEFGNLDSNIALSLFTVGGNSKVLDSLFKDEAVVIDTGIAYEELLKQYLN